MTTVTTKYNVGQTVYFVMNSTVEIIPAVVKHVHVYSPLSDEDISYTIITNHQGYSTSFDAVGESRLHTFQEAKTALLSWLDVKKAEVTALIDPVV